jgi:hypothetical protein
MLDGRVAFLFLVIVKTLPQTGFFSDFIKDGDMLPSFLQRSFFKINNLIKLQNCDAQATVSPEFLVNLTHSHVK